MLEKVLDSCKYVSKNSKHIKINYSKIDEISQSLVITNNTNWLESSPFGILDFDVKDIINLLLVYHSIGFSYWGIPKKWKIKTEKDELDGAFAMLYILINEFKHNKNFLSTNYLKNISFEEFEKLLKGNIEIPLLKQRYNNLIKINNIINKNMNGNFYNFIINIYSDNELFRIIINNFSDIFNDIAIYNGKEIYFYKLAQLLVSDILHIRQLKENVKVDYTHLIGCADYKIPQVLRGLGILEYSVELARLVDNKEKIKQGSVEEIEIRANALVALNEINRIVKNTCPIEVNDLIWLKSQEKNHNVKPYHLTRTRFY